MPFFVLVSKMTSLEVLKQIHIKVYAFSFKPQHYKPNKTPLLVQPQQACQYCNVVSIRMNYTLYAPWTKQKLGKHISRGRGRATEGRRNSSDITQNSAGITTKTTANRTFCCCVVYVYCLWMKRGYRHWQLKYIDCGLLLRKRAIKWELQKLNSHVQYYCYCVYVSLGTNHSCLNCHTVSICMCIHMFSCS